MKVRADIAELLWAGLSDKAIAQQLHVHRRTVRAARHTLGLPVHKPGPTPSNAEDVFWRRAQPTDDGHLLWTAPNRGIRGGPNRISVYQLAFRIRHGRPAVGHVTTGCGRPLCVHPAHVQDQPMRQHLATQYAAIFGATA